MCSVLPAPGSSVTLRVSFVEVHPESPLVRLWGLSGERREPYARLREEIQAAAGPRLASAPGNGGGNGGWALSVGDLCLVELGGRWLRCRVVGRQRSPGQEYRVFLLDEGRTVSAGAYYLARGRQDFFRLPSEALSCVLADLVPPGDAGAGAAGEPRGLAPGGGGGGWAPGAVEFLGCLHGKEVSGLVREVLVPQRLVVLELPWLLAQMHYLRLASQISPAAFRALLGASFTGAVVPPLAVPPRAPASAPASAPATPSQARPGPRAPEYFFPKLELHVNESVLVTQICDPHRVYCQLRSLSKEICRVSEVMSQAFEGAQGENLQDAAFPTPGSPCAARGIDGRWYRALLLEVYPGGGPEEQPGNVAQVICVDYGRKEFVTLRNLRRLPMECFRMPVVTYLFSLQGITDGGCGWTRSQISELKALLLGKIVQARIEAYCSFERVYYVTFFGEEGFNLNCLFGVQAHCLAQRFVRSHQGFTSDLMAEPETTGALSKKKPGALLGTLPAFIAPSLPSVRLKAGECHKAQVSFLQDPMHFCMCLQEYHQPLCHLKENMQDFYSQSKKLEGILLEPKPGSLCCVMLKDNSYHRAVVASVQGEGIEVYLVDRGNTEIVDLYKVKELLPQFRELPAVAVRCALANPSLGQLWSPSAIDYFKKTVVNKELVMQVLGVQGDTYVVELFDHSLAGEKNLVKIMSQGKYAVHHDGAVSETIQKPPDKPLRAPKEQGTNQNPVRKTSAKDETEFLPKSGRPSPCTSALTASQTAGGICSLPNEAVAKESCRAASNSLSHLAQNYSEIKPGLSCEGQLEVGSTVDVIVSCVESPGLFWCQLCKTSRELRLLMADIQHYCAHSVEPYDWPNPVCLAKYSEDGKWYRALIVSAVCPTEEVEVAYVDYGNRELVPLKNLCSTRAEFLKLQAQAFRCSLYNLIEPDSEDPFVWDEKATELFQGFVDSASKLELKCTIFALAALNNTYLLNIVDLITPFESVCHFLTREGLARAMEPEKPLTSSVHLLSYYYSMHDIKIGSEEVVFVTHVNDLCLFYCQLGRSADALEHLTNSISELSKKWHSLKSSPAPGNLYLAKYTDGSWYRAILDKIRPTKEVFFVDFGNTESLAKEDLILIPRDAYEILLLPMQAIKCSLSDTTDVPKEAIAWFEKEVLDKPLKALIVAKEPDGKLIVELYADNIQINAKLKEIFNLQCSEGLDKTAKNRESGSEARRPFFTGVAHSASDINRSVSKNPEPLGSGKPSAECREAKLFQQKTKREMATNSPLPVEKPNQTDPVPEKSRRYLPPQKREGKLDGLKSRNQNESCINSSLKKMCDLPVRNISPGLKTLVYVSHVNSPSDFYVQLVEDESLLDSISEKLNQSEMFENLNGQQLHVGDLMCAVFPEDGLWYRAVVQKQPSDDLVSVQYIDYGNMAVVDICKTCRLLEDCIQFPAMTIHCSLGGVKTNGLPEWTEEAVLYFTQSTSEIQMNCEFVEQLEGKWEVILCDREGNITADLVNSHLNSKKSLLVETSDKNETEGDLINLGEILSDKPSKPSGIQDAKSFLWKIPVIGQTVKTFARGTQSPGYFWCQFANLSDIGSIEKKVQEARKHADSNMADIKIGCCCLAKCSKDEKFYRAIVISVQGDTLRVTHVDYGTEELVTREMLRQITDELLTLPPQSFPCCLFGFNSSEGSWVQGINDIFCNKIVDSLLDVTVMEILCNGPYEIPLFVVNLECQGESINEQLKSFWVHNTEDDVSTVANILTHKGQCGDAEADLEVVLNEVGMSACTSMASKDSKASEDFLCASELFQPTEKCSASARNVGLCKTKGKEYPDRHVQTTSEVPDIRGQQTVSEMPRNEMDHSVPETQSDSKMSVLNCTDVSEFPFPASIGIEVLGQNPFESQEEVEGQKATQTQDPFEVELPPSSEEDSSDLEHLEVPVSSEPKDLLAELEALRMHAFESLLELESTDVKRLLCEAGGETSKLVERELEVSPLPVDEMDYLVSCGQESPPEVLTFTMPVLQTAETKELSLLPDAPLPPSPEIQSPCSESKLKPQAIDLCEIGQAASEQNDIKQAVLEKSSEQVEMRPVMCRGFKETESNLAVEDPAGMLLVGEQSETSSQSEEKNETTCESEGFDDGSKCLVWTGVHSYEAQVLEITAESTKVLHDGMGTYLSENSLAVEAVKEAIDGTDNHAGPLGLNDQEH